MLFCAYFHEDIDILRIEKWIIRRKNEPTRVGEKHKSKPGYDALETISSITSVFNALVSEISTKKYAVWFGFPKRW